MNVTTLIPDGTGLVDWPTLSTVKKSVVTVGGFDGMHRGHLAVVKRTVALAQSHRAYSVVVMFDPRPALVHGYAATHDGEDPAPGTRDPDALTSVHQRLRIMHELGVDHVLVVHYTLAFAAKSFRFFLGQLVGKLGMRTLVLGSDAAMGANRTGDIAAIRNLSEATGVFELSVVEDLGPGYVRVPAVITPRVPDRAGEPQDPTAQMTKAELRAWSKEHQGRKTRVWSSSYVRYLLSQGRIRDANEVLGSRHAIEGLVVHGEGLGRTLGFPTANLGDDIEGYIPVDGVYAGWLVDLGERNHDASGSEATSIPAQANGETVGFSSATSPSDEIRMAAHSPWRWPAAISIGTKPTYDDGNGANQRVIEPYAITKDWLELYGHTVRVEFSGFLSPQIAFPDSEALKRAMGEWSDKTLALVAGNEAKDEAKDESAR
ncbi:MAG: riboflavin kinase [Bifidobacterium mongoliense]|jgi:riboflavin kinase/FMN adenylyltransferase|uniref:riboflavin kinase n=1 Tax=Bifidobacterium mongoliense TaxID=518643 RepID=UPI002F35A99F